jgi:hypothetical protein
MVADAPGALEEYERSQTLSAYSVTRLLAAEQAAAADLLAWTKGALGAALDGDDRPEVADARRRISAASTGTEVGDGLALLLTVLPREEAVRARVRGVLAQMIDREVAALADLPS